MKRLGKEQYTIMGAGSLFAVLAVILVMLGNPLNMGFCIACFYRDIAGALGLHSAAVVQYARPEIIGLFLGATVMALLRKEHKSRGGSSALTRFVISFFVMIGALVFLGCPFRMLLRIGGGDLNAVVALLGFAAGVIAGSILLNKGFSLGRSYTQGKVEGLIPTIIAIVLLAILLFLPALLKSSTSGPGSMHAPILISLAAGAVVGLLAQRTRFC
ncbi:MAG: YedE-related selenium metabolism membrane protein, partial [Spirochaetia bacterium]|nr:YedE-related selenium metabolism membrane protein [Spirochaetia bacterium]